LAVLGAGGDFELSWREVGSGAISSVLESLAAVRATIAAQHVQYEAQLTVRSIGGPLEGFTVRLPPGAEVEDSVQPGYAVARGSQPSQRTAEVRLRRPTYDAVTVRLTAKCARAAPGADESLDLAGFEVLGAVRQSGHVAVVAEGDWRLEWTARDGVREAEQLPAWLAGNGAAPAAALEFYRQPFALKARVSRQTAQVTVEPEHRLTVRRDRVELESRLSYRMRGAKIAQLQLQLNGWVLDGVEPAGLLAMDAEPAGDPSLATLPLAQRTRAPLDVVIRAHQRLEPDATRIDVALPRPVADEVSPAQLLVVGADNIEIIPRPAETVGLTRQPHPSGIALPAGPFEAFAYRQSGAVEPRFTADLRVHPRQVSVDSFALVRVEADAARVEQTLAYRIAFEPLDRRAGRRARPRIGE
jgi:hypothetical protein